MRLSRWVYAWLMGAGEQTPPLDLYLPEQATELLPVVVWIHAGCLDHRQ